MAKKKAVPAEKTCAVCDCKLDDSAITVKFKNHTVEVCCDECAVKLREARDSMGGRS